MCGTAPTLAAAASLPTASLRWRRRPCCRRGRRAPPMIDGIDAGRQAARSAGGLRQAALNRLSSIGGERHRRRHLGAHDVLMIEQPLAVGPSSSGSSTSRSRLGEQYQELRQHRVKADARDQHRHGRAFVASERPGSAAPSRESACCFEQAVESRRVRCSSAARSAFSVSATSNRARA